MSDQPANTVPPPAYGSVVDNAATAPVITQPPTSYAPPPAGYAPPPAAVPPPAGSGEAGYAPAPGMLPPYSGPQPGVTPAPGPYPNEPPPKYEPNNKAFQAPGAAPYQQGYPAGYQTGQVYRSQTVVVAPQNPNYSAVPTTMQCPYCQSLITTSMNYQAGGLTWLACGLLCLFGCWGGCCLIPFCMQDLQDAEHTCPSCSRTVGVYRRL